MFGISEIAILLIIVVLIFGAKKLPELARSMGKSARILKSEARALKGDGGSAAPSQAAGSSTGPRDGSATSPHTDVPTDLGTDADGHRVIRGTATERPGTPR
ncbi:MULTISPECIES: Sec-independent protein translocase subunit TatA [Streptomyces]|uniref:Sec-independent protein translocase subunit TatA n=1 Tax=Streptomyces TaxID=1883 RepID=UPI00081AF639|nr:MULTISPECIES: Sec-independent protein translocase subunit TatA [unclassified Streptomyces]MYQ51526.1 twin-arginine translocase TatA/TatE family subunit [Streptomyces sp. SID4941]SCD63003.1 sec-independent protein translocase protein TatA [Streptomyces sp. PalvLS-984]SDD15123.1 sec-independent protein translocase protein TatA [Streptomyces sp. AmelKG-A3]